MRSKGESRRNEGIEEEREGRREEIREKQRREET